MLGQQKQKPPIRHGGRGLSKNGQRAMVTLMLVIGTIKRRPGNWPCGWQTRQAHRRSTVHRSSFGITLMFAHNWVMARCSHFLPAEPALLHML